MGGRPVRLALALVAVAAYVAVLFYPYEWRSPLPRNRAVWTERGSLEFREPGLARADFSAWNSRAIVKQRFELTLRVRATDPTIRGPARILSVSVDPHRRNVMVGQRLDALVVRLRTPATDANGWPDRTIPGVFGDPVWRDLRVAVKDRLLEIDVDGRRRWVERLPPEPLSGWDRAYPLLLGNELTGDRAWRGEIARATIRVDRESFDLLRAERLDRPRWIRWFHHPPRLVPLTRFDLFDGLANLVGFVPLGFIVGWLGGARRGRLGPAAAAIAALSVSIEVAQWWMPTRYPSVDDVVLNVIGGGLGLLLARRFRAGTSADP